MYYPIGSRCKRTGKPFVTPAWSSYTGPWGSEPPIYPTCSCCNKTPVMYNDPKWKRGGKKGASNDA